MNAGSAMPSRANHEVRHIVIARQARSGCPKWNTEEMPPRPLSTKTNRLPPTKKSLESEADASSSQKNSVMNSPVPRR